MAVLDGCAVCVLLKAAAVAVELRAVEVCWLWQMMT
jgi:hypothetical protein